MSVEEISGKFRGKKIENLKVPLFVGGLPKILGVYGGKRRPVINWESPGETA